MRTRLGVAVLGVLGGLLLGLGGGMAFVDHGQQDWHRLASIGGYAVGIGALVLAGYGLVIGAPVWLRLIVSAGLPLLAVSVWQIVDDELRDRLDGWRAPAAGHLAAGALLLVFGLVAARGAEQSSVRYEPSHR